MAAHLNPRLQRRVLCDLDVGVVTSSGTQVAVLTQFSVDGAFVEGLGLEPKQRIRLVFIGVASGDFTVDAEVVHCQDTGAGVRFLDGVGRERIHALLGWVKEPAP